ncbi:IS3 family transposase [Olsenella uli]|uniref:IS3 family transposase n=1 Tax=Olsenella uli TaxID=133926 RepID=UPI00195A2D8F|nr:IS3 family transposase [Olsenella uli]MBM6815911.1 IS3 family transposase [Olsenella uli]
MFDPEDVELALLALEEGMTPREAGELVGAGRETVRRWAAGRRPHPRSGPARAKIPPKPKPKPKPKPRPAATRREGHAVTGAEREAYEAAMTENMLLRAVLDDLKAAGSDPRSISRRRRVELGERLRAATGLPLREITRFLGISRSSYAYHRARLGRDKYAAPRDEVEALFRSMGGGRGYRAVHAELGRRGTRVSEKVVRRLMRERGLSAARRRRRAWSSYAGEASPAPPNLPLRPDGTHDFSAPAPNLLWVTDITEFRLPCGSKAHLSAVLDCFGGRPVSWSIGASPHRPARELVARGRLRDARARGAARRPLRPRRALPLAGLGRGVPARPPRQEHVAQGPQLRQRPHGGLLRDAQERVLPRA